jgi:hypothetical protein
MYLQWNLNKHFLRKKRIAHGTMEIVSESFERIQENQEKPVATDKKQ